MDRIAVFYLMLTEYSQSADADNTQRNDLTGVDNGNMRVLRVDQDG